MGLDPIAKQIYAVSRWDSTLKKNVMTVQVGIDGYRLVAERTGRYAPGREPTFTYGPNGELVSATSYVMKMTDDGKWHEVAATAFYAEYVQTNKEGQPTSFWKKMGHSQTAKCAETLALRKAFPSELSAVRSEEEMAQADNPFEGRTIEVENATPKLVQIADLIKPEPQTVKFEEFKGMLVSVLSQDIEDEKLTEYLTYVAERQNVSIEEVMASNVKNEMRVKMFADKFEFWKNKKTEVKVEEK